MRECNKEIELQKVTNIVEIATTEEIVRITEDKVSNLICVDTISKNANGDIINNENTTIYGDYYNMLMSESPSFAPNKPQNEYREDDIWYIIDLIRNSQ